MLTWPSKWVVDTLPKTGSLEGGQGWELKMLWRQLWHVQVETSVLVWSCGHDELS